MTTEEKDIRQFFQELKINDQILVPDFETTYQAAVKSRIDRWWYMRRAAAIALVVVTSFTLLWYTPQQAPDQYSETPISSWVSPIDPGLYPDLPQQSISNWQSPTSFTVSSAPATGIDLSNWKSPTDFLLTTSTKQQ